MHECLEKFLAISWSCCEVLAEGLCWVVPYSPPLLRNSCCSSLAMIFSPKHNRQFIPRKTDTLELLKGGKSGDRNGKKSPICRFSADFSGVPIHQEILTNLFSHIWTKMLLSRGKCPSSIQSSILTWLSEGKTAYQVQGFILIVWSWVCIFKNTRGECDPLFQEQRILSSEVTMV